MVRQYLPEREDGLVAWRVRGKRKRTRWTRLDVPPASEGLPERNLGPKGEDKARDTGSGARDGAAGRKGGGKVGAQGDAADVKATEADEV